MPSSLDNTLGFGSLDDPYLAKLIGNNIPAKASVVSPLAMSAPPQINNFGGIGGGPGLFGSSGGPGAGRTPTGQPGGTSGLSGLLSAANRANSLYKGYNQLSNLFGSGFALDPSITGAAGAQDAANMGSAWAAGNTDAPDLAAASNQQWLDSLGAASDAAPVAAEAPTALAASDLAPVGVDAATASPTITGLGGEAAAGGADTAGAAGAADAGASGGLGAGAGFAAAIAPLAITALLAEHTGPYSLGADYWNGFKNPTGTYGTPGTYTPNFLELANGINQGDMPPSDLLAQYPGLYQAAAQMRQLQSAPMSDYWGTGGAGNGNRQHYDEGGTVRHFDSGGLADFLDSGSLGSPSWNDPQNYGMFSGTDYNSIMDGGTGNPTDPTGDLSQFNFTDLNSSLANLNPDYLNVPSGSGGVLSGILGNSNTIGKWWNGLNSGQQLGSLGGLAALLTGGFGSGSGANMTQNYKPSPPPMFANTGPGATPNYYGNFTSAPRQQTHPTGIDYAHYGQGPEAQFFTQPPQPSPLAQFSATPQTGSIDHGGMVYRPMPINTAISGPLHVMARGGEADHGHSPLAASHDDRSYHVQGPGDGVSDSIPAVLSDGEYVVRARVVSALGNGSNTAGARALDRMQENVEKQYGKEMSKGKDRPIHAKEPQAYMKGKR